MGNEKYVLMMCENIQSDETFVLWKVYYYIYTTHYRQEYRTAYNSKDKN